MKYAKYFVFLYIILSLFIGSTGLAQAFDFVKKSGLKNTANLAGYNSKSWTAFPNDFLGARIAEIVAFLGIIFIVLIIYAGYRWMASRGNEQEVEKAKALLKNSIIGLVIVLAAYMITTLAQELFNFSTGQFTDE